MIDFDKVLSPVVKEMKPSGIRRFFDLANTMEDVISLGVGEPDFPTPWNVRAEGIKSLERGNTRYTANRGTLPLRRAIAAYLERKYGTKYNPEKEILVTVGGSEAIDLALRAILVPGDEVIIPQPSYVCYEPLTRLYHATPVIYKTEEKDAFRVTPEGLQKLITPKTKALILPYPCNPTGAIMTRADLEKIGEVLKMTNIVVISDEIYSELTFGEYEHVSAASVPTLADRTVTVNGFSKAFSMTGWRLGYACAPEALAAQMTKIHQFAIMCAPTTSQAAACEALLHCDAEVARMKEEYNDRRLVMVKGFNDMGLTCREPFGAFYAFPNITSTGLSSEEFCQRLLEEEHVAVVPGTAFGEGGEGFVRASYCYSIAHIREALTRTARFLEKLKK